jgi:hypothetical protein
MTLPYIPHLSVHLQHPRFVEYVTPLAKSVFLRGGMSGFRFQGTQTHAEIDSVLS